MLYGLSSSQRPTDATTEYASPDLTRLLPGRNQGPVPTDTCTGGSGRAEGGRGQEGDLYTVIIRALTCEAIPSLEAAEAEIAEETGIDPRDCVTDDDLAPQIYALYCRMRDPYMRSDLLDRLFAFEEEAARKRRGAS